MAPPITTETMLSYKAPSTSIDSGSGFGVGGTALKWFTSYLSQRTQQVQIKGTLSEKKQLTTGVPQGSCLGPGLFTIYVGDFFIMKIQKIRTKLDSQDPEPISIPRMPVKEEDVFISFQPLTEDDVRKLIKQSPNKQCSSDPIPTWLLTKTVKKKPAMPWYNDEIKGLKRDRRKAERQWLQHRGYPIKNVTFREEYRLVRNRYRSAIDEAKTEYYSGKVQECTGDQKKLFEIIKSLTKPLQQQQYPDSDSLKDLADAFGDFFIMKIQKIRTKLDSQDPEPISIPRVPVKEEDVFLSFQTLTEDDVRKLIKQSPNKQCSSDPIPTWLLKECLDSLLPVLTLLVNKSLQIGYFPEEWKNALVKPLLKKLGLELVFPSFRPVSNLPFISKLTEKASVNQLSGHMNKVRSLPSGQSAYRPFHSTETALLKVQSDILLNMDDQKVTLLVMLDLSAAFDTIDHSILLETLGSGFGVGGTALKWFTSYLSQRTQQVQIKGTLSEKKQLTTGVPQGSCLGPGLFTIYVADLFQIIQKHLPDA